MRETVKNLARRFGRHLVSPITVRGLIAVAIIAWFAWTLMDRAYRRSEREAELRQILVSAQATQESIGSIRQSWVNFEEQRAAFVENQQKMIENLREVTNILKQESQIREKLLTVSTTPKKKRTRKRRAALKPCFRIEERETKHGSATVLRQVLVAVPCK